MKIIEVKAYKFSELSDAAKEKARDWYREGNMDDNFWSEYVIDEAVEQGKLLGIDFKERRVPLMNGKTRGEPCIYWSGFSSQGDGACFEGSWCAGDVQADKVAEDWGDSADTTEIRRIAGVLAEIAKEWPRASFTVTHSGHYSHEYCTNFSVEMDEDPDMVVPDGAEDDLIEVARDFMKWIYRRLENEWRYRNSDECVDEEIEANDLLFTEDGRRSVSL